MYGGLFGDLPAAKNAKKETGSTSNADDPLTSASVGAPSSGNGGPSVSSTASFDTKKVTTPSILQNVGKSGTSMAFIPTAALQRRKSNKRPAVASAPISEAAVKRVTTTRTEGTEFLESVIPEPALQSVDSNAVNGPDPLYGNEKEDRIRLHESVTDPYDPLVPNDLLQYWERKAIVAQREQLELQRQQTLQEQERMREELRLERERLVQQGSVEQLERGMSSRGGRGRGVSNLPAWLVEKQKNQRDLGQQRPS